MELKEYLDKQGLTLRDFAEHLDITLRYMIGISTGNIKPSRRLAADIEAATDGLVKVEFSTKTSRVKRDLAKKKKDKEDYQRKVEKAVEKVKSSHEEERQRLMEKAKKAREKEKKQQQEQFDMFERDAALERVRSIEKPYGLQ